MPHSMMVAAEVIEGWQVGLGEGGSDGGTRGQKAGARGTRLEEKGCPGVFDSTEASRITKRCKREC